MRGKVKYLDLISSIVVPIEFPKSRFLEETCLERFHIILCLGYLNKSITDSEGTKLGGAIN
jgi:hypothetical protein